MKLAIERIKFLIQKNATHRDGWRLGDVSAYRMFDNLCDEIEELRNAKSADEALDELADVIAILLHYQILRNFTTEEVEARIINKLHARFATRGPKGESNATD